CPDEIAPATPAPNIRCSAAQLNLRQNVIGENNEAPILGSKAIRPALEPFDIVVENPVLPVALRFLGRAAGKLAPLDVHKQAGAIDTVDDEVDAFDRLVV